MNYLLAIIILWQILLLPYIFAQSFISPVSGANYPLGGSVNVTVNLGTRSEVFVSQNCGGTVSPRLRLILALPTTIFTLPSGYTGTCTYTGYATNSGQQIVINGVSVNVIGAVIITTPTTTNPLTKIAAGFSTSVTLSYNPAASVSYQASVNLTCSSQTLSQIIIGTSMSFNVPPSFYGDTCTFSVVAPGYISSNTVSVTITQPLAFTSPSNNSVITINNPISISMATGSVNASASVVLQFFCTSYTPAIPNFTVITSSILPFSYTYPPTAYGPCILYVVSAPTYLVLPGALNLSLKYALTISSPSIIYNGQTFSATVSSAVSTVITSVTLNLVYNVSGSSTTRQSYLVTINQLATLTAPLNLVLGTGYTLQVNSDANFNAATSTTFSAANVQLKFAQPPVSSTYIYPNSIPILINSDNVSNILPPNQAITVTLTCNGIVVGTVSVTIGIQRNYASPTSAIGACSLSAVSTVNYLISPTSIWLTLKGTVAISTVASTIAAGQTIQLGLTYDPFSTSVTSSVFLTCPNLTPSTTSVTGTSPSYTVPSGLYGNSCVFSVVSQNYNSNNTVSSVITQNLSFSSPSSTLITINNTIPIKVATSPNTTISDSVQLKFTCFGSSTMSDQLFNVTTSASSNFNYQYPSNAFGSCSLSINSASSYFVLPTPLSLNLKYSLNISAPSTIYDGQPFSTTVSCSVNPFVPSVTLNLVYTPTVGSPLTVQSFIGVGINELSTLTAPYNLITGSGYTLQVFSNENFNSASSTTFSASNSTVSISSSSSAPAGGSASISLTFNPPPRSPIFSTITLTCPNVGFYSDGGLGTLINFPVPSTLYGSSCTFSVTASGYVSSNTASSIITQPLTFNSPANNTNITIYDPISVGMSTGSVNASANIVLRLTCLSYTTEIPTFTVITSSYLPYSYNNYPTEAYGPCTLGVVSAPSYLTLPSPIHLTLQYNFTIAAPAKIFPDQPFVVTVSCPVAPGIDMVTLNLIYIRSIPITKSFASIDTNQLKKTYSSNLNTEIVITSYNVTVNQQSTLIAPNDLIIGSSYILQINSNEDLTAATSSTITAAILQTLTISTPNSIRFGQEVSLSVATDGPYPVFYTASFSSSTGSYEINGLLTGLTYNIVPPGLFGKVVITATAVNAEPASSSLNIFKAQDNIPVAFIPAIRPHYPSVFSNLTAVVIT